MVEYKTRNVRQACRPLSTL